MYFLRLTFVILCFSLTIITSCNQEQTKPIPKASKGQIDLENWNFIQSGNIPLDGEWEFYFEQFLSSDDIANGNGKLSGYVNFPGTWKNIEINQTKISGKGYGTFRLLVNLPIHPTISVKFATIGTAYKAFVNGREASSGGQIGTVEKETKPGFHFSIVPIYSNSQLELILHIANFSDPNGGLWDSIIIGDTASILITKKFQFVMDIFLVSTLFIMGIYHLTLFLLRRKDVSPLFFGIFCIIIGFRTLLTSERILHNDFSLFSWNFLFSFEYLTFYISVPLFVGFVYSLYKEEFSLLFTKIVFGVSTLFSLIVLFTEVKFFTEVNIFYQLFILFFLSYLIYTMIRALIEGRDDIVYFFLGVILIIVAVIHDIFVAMHIIHSFYIFGYGLVVFILFQSTIIASRFSRAFFKSEELAESLIGTNFAIARFVPSEFLRLLNRNNIIDVKLGDHLKKEMTIFFADIRGFTSLSEKLSSEEVFSFLNNYFKETISIISKNHGFIDKIIGDGIMAIFPKSPSDALQASTDILQKMNQWNIEREKTGQTSISIGIGIHTGIVSLGTVGTEERLDTTVIGDTVNIASRLENLNKDYQSNIILSETVYSSLDENEKKTIRELDYTLIRGREKNLLIYESFAGHTQDSIQKKIAIKSKYEEALSLFKQGKIAEAKVLFMQCKTIINDDPILSIYLERCNSQS
ncbi:MAG: adenylate/guanylate cyclase domain-containing protein [Leptospiraceae bacterium]|nr:adenylate/guanylate cyclase domain-containing protein [Leptospiraceae bacterium]